VLVRCVAFFTAYLCCEAAGILASFGLWVTHLGGRGARAQAFAHANLVLQRWWAAALFGAGRRIFGLRVRVEHDGVIGEQPVILFVRHASTADTVLPAVFFANRHRFALRYVLKRELQWDPCLDIVGNRLPNYFARRGSADTAREIAAVAELMDGLGPREGVLIFPEGTRFSEQKRARVLARLREHASAEIVELSRKLLHVLPPRLGGPLALLEKNCQAAIGADAVFCAHVGLEGAASFREFVNGALVGREVRISFKRVPFEEIPGGREERVRWLFEQWADVDRWIGLHKEALPAPAASATAHSLITADRRSRRA
jgi:1-acyl-sn-glycerol-3-phosphate acyltransferase